MSSSKSGILFWPTGGLGGFPAVLAAADCMRPAVPAVAARSPAVAAGTAAVAAVVAAGPDLSAQTANKVQYRGYPR